MRFLRRAHGSPQTIGILSGAFDAATNAHLGLAFSALHTRAADEVLLVMPETFPHKAYGAIGLDRRLHMLGLAIGATERLSIGVAEGGLFLEIAREARAVYGAEARLRFLCGRDTAERILNWNYAGFPPLEEQLREYD